MKTRLIPIFLCMLSILLLTNTSMAAPAAEPLGTAFTYQGRLDRSGEPYTGSCDFQFSLWDAGTEGLQIGSTLAQAGQAVSDGLFTTKLDFGVGTFNGDARWLEVSVQCPSETAYTVFPRQELTAAPYALYALGAPWSGLTGKPAGLDDGDDDTLYNAGNGLLLSTTTFSIDPAYVAGNTGRPPFSLSTLDSGGYVGYFTSITIGVDGLGLISYSDDINSDLKVAHCNDISCSTASTFTLDSGGSVGSYTSITIGADGLGLISYFDGTNGDLKVAHCTDISCSTASTFTLDSGGNVGYFTSITIGVDGLGLISYSDSYQL